MAPHKLPQLAPLIVTYWHQPVFDTSMPTLQCGAPTKLSEHLQAGHAEDQGLAPRVWQSIIIIIIIIYYYFYLLLLLFFFFF